MASYYKARDDPSPSGPSYESKPTRALNLATVLGSREFGVRREISIFTASDSLRTRMTGFHPSTPVSRNSYHQYNSSFPLLTVVFTVAGTRHTPALTILEAARVKVRPIAVQP